MRNLFDSDVNNAVAPRNVYGDASGPTTGSRAGAQTPYVAGRMRAGNGSGAVAPPAAVNGGGGGNGVMGQPFSWWIVLIGLLVGLMFTAQRFGGAGEDFKTVRLSIYNIVVISLASIIGLGFFKLVFARYRVPGLSEYVLAI